MQAFLLLCLLGFAAAQAPLPCVTPQQWEGRFFEINQQEQFRVRGRFSYDSVYHRERIIDDVAVGPQDSYYDVIALFDTQVEYVYNFRNNSCTRRPLTRQWRDFGIRANSTSLGEAYVGTSAIPNAGILVSLWAHNYTAPPPSNETVRSFGSWTYLQCLPVRHVSHSSTYGRTVREFFDITVGISNPSVFVPRPECLRD